MTQTVRRLGLGIGAAVMALGLAAAVFASPQDNPGPGGPMRPRGGRMGGAMMPGPGGPGGPFGDFRMLANRLGLSDSQKAQIKTIMQGHEADFKALGDRSVQAHQALRAAIEADTVDEAAIRNASAGVAAVEADMAVLHANIRAQVWQVLTPDQQAQAKQLEAQMQERMQNFRTRMQNRRGGQK